MCLGGRPAEEGRLPGEQFVQHAAERELVRLSVRRATSDLLRGHVTGRSQNRARLRLGRHRTGPGPRPRETEIEYLHTSIFGQKQVFRLDVAVDDAASVGGGQALGDGPADPHRLLPANRPVG